MFIFQYNPEHRIRNDIIGAPADPHDPRQNAHVLFFRLLVFLSRGCPEVSSAPVGKLMTPGNQSRIRRNQNNSLYQSEKNSDDLSDKTVVIVVLPRACSRED